MLSLCLLQVFGEIPSISAVWSMLKSSERYSSTDSSTGLSEIRLAECSIVQCKNRNYFKIDLKIKMHMKKRGRWIA
jgi:hypothetical protein